MKVVLGRVLGAHGVHGRLRVRWFGDGPENLLAQRHLAVCEAPDGTGARHYEMEEGEVGKAGEVRLKLKGLEHRDAAQMLRGGFVQGDSEGLRSLPEGEFYWYQLIGCRVVLTSGRELGRVWDLMETGAHDVLRVRGEDGLEFLVPTARELLPGIHLDEGRLVAEDVPGLYEAN